MPVFNFECTKCKTVYPGVVLREEKLDKCPKCGCKKAKKLFTPTINIQTPKGPQNTQELEAAIKVTAAQVINGILTGVAKKRRIHG